MYVMLLKKMSTEVKILFSKNAKNVLLHQSSLQIRIIFFLGGYWPHGWCTRPWSEQSGMSPGWGHGVVFLGKTLSVHLTVPLSTQEYKYGYQ